MLCGKCFCTPTVHVNAKVITQLRFEVALHLGGKAFVWEAPIPMACSRSKKANIRQGRHLAEPIPQPKEVNHPKDFPRTLSLLLKILPQILRPLLFRYRINTLVLWKRWKAQCVQHQQQQQQIAQRRSRNNSRKWEIDGEREDCGDR